MVCLKFCPVERSGPTLSGLYFSFALGNIIGPLLASEALTPTNTATSTTLSDSKQFIYHIPGMTNLQSLHTLIGIVLTCLGVLCLITSLIHCRKYEKIYCPKSGNNGSHVARSQKFCFSHYFFLGSILLYFLTSNGINFAFSNFLTVYAMKSTLGETKSFGAQSTSLFFLCQTGTRLLSAICSSLLTTNPTWIIAGDMAFLALGCGVFVLAPENNTVYFQIGVGLVGVGVSCLIPSGLAWVRNHIEVTSKVVAWVLICTSAGAQIFKIPVSLGIEHEPRVLIHLLFISTGTVLGLFLAARAVAWHWQQKK